MLEGENDPPPVTLTFIGAGRSGEEECQLSDVTRLLNKMGVRLNEDLPFHSS
jgi:hypothetical protein